MVSSEFELPDDLAQSLTEFVRDEVGARDHLNEYIVRCLRQYVQVYAGPWTPYRALVFEEGSGLSDVSINHDKYLTEP